MKEQLRNNREENRKLSRKSFLKKTGIAAIGLTIIPRYVMGGKGFKAPSDMVNVAGIGFGNQGGADLQNIASMDVPTKRATPLNLLKEPYSGIKPPRVTVARGAVDTSSVIQMGDANSGIIKHANIYALCDVDHEYSAHVFKGYPKAKQYTDFRKLIENEKSLDAVIIAVPDHNHAVIAAYAMAAGKHVFVEKPMAKTIYETRKLAALAKKFKVVTQMGNQGHNVEGTFRTMEWIQSGKIGTVKEVNLWTDRPVWPQGYLKRPEGQPVPNNLDYDLWLGPAPEKPYNADMLHFNWRGLRDYGTGAMGDMGAHIFDAPIQALKLGLPKTIQATSTPFSDDYLPKTQSVKYVFPARGNLPETIVIWRDGGVKPFRPGELEANRQLQEALYIGDKGLIMHGSHGKNPELIPNEPEFSVQPWIERPKSVYVDFIDAIKEGRKAKNDFEISSVLNEIMLLTNIAVVSQKLNITLEYDGVNMKITNLPEANNYFHYEYRKGWEQYLEV